MKFYVKERLFSWRDRFDIYDEEGNSAYYVKGKFISLGLQFKDTVERNYRNY